MTTQLQLIIIIIIIIIIISIIVVCVLDIHLILCESLNNFFYLEASGTVHIVNSGEQFNLCTLRVN